MPLIPARAAGVAFTADPATGNPFVIPIAVCRGLGTSVVNNRGNSDLHRLDWTTLEDRSSFRKKRNGANPQRTGTLRLGELAREIDRFFGQRMDIEFAFANDNPVILQARPINGLPVYFPHNPEDNDPRVHRCGAGSQKPISPLARHLHEGKPKALFALPPWPLEVAELLFQHGRMFYRESPSTEYEECPERPGKIIHSFAEWRASAIPPTNLSAGTHGQISRATKSSLLSASARKGCSRRTEEDLRGLAPDALAELLQAADENEAKARYLYIASSGSTYESLRRLEVLSRDWLTEGDYTKATQMAMAWSRGRHV